MESACKLVQLFFHGAAWLPPTPTPPLCVGRGCWIEMRATAGVGTTAQLDVTAM